MLGKLPAVVHRLVSRFSQEAQPRQFVNDVSDSTVDREREPGTRRGGARLVDRLWRVHERVRGMSESPQATRESAGEGVTNWCPDVARSCCSRWYCHSRIESVGEGVANWWPCVVESCPSQSHYNDRIKSAGGDS